MNMDFQKSKLANGEYFVKFHNSLNQYLKEDRGMEARPLVHPKHMIKALIDPKLSMMIRQKFKAIMYKKICKRIQAAQDSLKKRSSSKGTKDGDPKEEKVS